MTDSPIQPPAARFERVVAALGALARPFVLYAAGFSAAVATIRLSLSDAALIEKAAYITAAWAGVGLIYGAKAIEERGRAKSEAAVQIAQSTGNAP